MPPKESPLLFRHPSRRLPARHLREFAECLRETVAGGREFVCLLTDDRELRRLNRQFLGKDYATDVLSFPSGALWGELSACEPAVVPANVVVARRKPTPTVGSQAGKLTPQKCLNYSLGEIAISTERAAAQAAEYGHGVEEEVSILMLHGLLHLLGMDHETDHGRMSRAEIRWRKKLGLPASLTERTRT